MRRERIRVRAPGFAVVMLSTKRKGANLGWPARTNVTNYDFLMWLAMGCSWHGMKDQLDALAVMGSGLD